MQRPVVAITGAQGSIGTKLARFWLGTRVKLSNRETAPLHLLLLDDYEGFHKGVYKDPRSADPLPGFDPGPIVGTFEHVQAELLTWGEWTSCLEGVDTVVHFAAVNPYPECTWHEAKLSMDMNNVVAMAAARAGVRRFIFTSSNHTVGNHWRDGATLNPPAAPAVTPATLPIPDKFRVNKDAECDFSAYASAKLAGESLIQTLPNIFTGFSTIAVRIGWCQPGENVPGQMSASGTPTVTLGEESSAPSYSSRALGYDDPDVLLQWFHMMWLSNRDLCQLMTRCMISEFDGTLVVNGMSGNSGRRWSTDNYATIGYHPEDDAKQHPPYTATPPTPYARL